MKIWLRSNLVALTGCGLLVVLGGCHSAVVGLKPAAIGPPWAAVEPSPTSMPAKASGGSAVQHRRPQYGLFATTSPIADANWLANLHNATSQIVTIASYQHIWDQSLQLIKRMGYSVSWQSYRLGVITTVPRIGPEILQWWRPDTTSLNSLAESTLNTYRRSFREVIQRMGKQKFRISFEVLVERRTNPQGAVGAVAFNGISAFGGNVLPLLASHAPPGTGGAYWYPAGRDPLLEKKLLKALFKKI